MKTSQINKTQNSVTGTRFLVSFVIVFFFGIGMFGQNTKSVVLTPAVTFESISFQSVAFSDDTVATNQEGIKANSNMNFVSWFMGSKQTPNADKSTDASTNSKKQMIISGIVPNRLLLKAFLKKATNYTNTIV